MNIQLEGGVTSGIGGGASSVIRNGSAASFQRRGVGRGRGGFRGGRGLGRGRGRGGRGGGQQKPNKTAAELDAELDSYAKMQTD